MLAIPLLFLMASDTKPPVQAKQPAIVQEIEVESLRRDLAETKRQLIVVQRAVILLLDRSKALEDEVRSLREDLDEALTPVPSTGLSTVTSVKK